MLLAVEGGGFFSSSASGYSKGLTLLFLGQKSEDKPMKVAPWNQYQLVEQDIDSNLQLASTKNKLSRGCASYVCFGRTSAGHERQSAPKIGPTHEQLVLAGVNVSERDKELASNLDGGNITRNHTLKSSLKRRPCNIQQPTDKQSNEQDALDEARTPTPELVEKRKVQWTDACGKELVEIREFEQRYPSIKISSSIDNREQQRSLSIKANILIMKMLLSCYVFYLLNISQKILSTVIVSWSNLGMRYMSQKPNFLGKLGVRPQGLFAES